MPKKKSIVFTFGRFQPPTIGHEKLIGAVMAHAKSMGGEHRIYASQTTDPKKNPLTHDQKIGFMRDMFPKANIIKGDSKTKTFMEVLYQLQNEGYETVHMMVGDDRVSEMETTVKRYLNGKNQDTALNFKEFKVVSAGKRDPDAVGVEGMSASKMRAAVAAGNFAAFQSGLPKGFKRGKELFKTLQKGMEAMKPKKKKTVKENAEMINEVTPPDEKAERLVKKRKGDFKKRYGEDWASYLYGVAWKQYNKRHGIKTKTRLGEPITEAEQQEVNEAPLSKIKRHGKGWREADEQFDDEKDAEKWLISRGWKSIGIDQETGFKSFRKGRRTAFIHVDTTMDVTVQIKEEVEHIVESVDEFLDDMEKAYKKGGLKAMVSTGGSSLRDEMTFMAFVENLSRYMKGVPPATMKYIKKEIAGMVKPADMPKIAKYVKEEVGSIEEETKGFDPKAYYAHFGGRIVGPYKSKDAAWKDTGGDVDWIKQGKDLTDKEKKKLNEESILDILLMLEATIPAYAWVKEINREKKTATLQWTDDNGDPVEEEVPMDEIPGFFAGASKPLRTRKTDKFGNLLSKMGKINPKKIGATAQQNQQTATELKDLIDGKPMGTVITIYGKKYGKKDDHTVNLMKRRLMGREIYVLKSTGKEVELNITGAGLQVVDAKSKRILLDKGNDATW